jgi:hypothetical protein
VTVCITCDKDIRRTGETASGLAVWEHDGEWGLPTPDHHATPKPQCHKCKSFNYAFYETNWGYGWRCADCGDDFYHSLGD